ncbi:ATP synthase subunit I [Paenibacillus segetis]|uniref:ATP synthase subunit I n=1 Tax=Paenibacillus segetis TaxID=1325360 RepID=A0ABQ1YQG8_9BACL|nr:ATP synthase subunit I [Paenibacillus segetis]GGH32714.1 hypothetical protein GCM10008013_37300 [Paenibacillus segetis]
MIDMNSIVKVVNRVTLLLLSVMFLGWALLPDYKLHIAGFILGLLIGLFNLGYLSRKVQGLVNYVVTTEKKSLSLGFLTRLCMTLLVVMFGVKIEHFSLETIIIGLFIPQLLTIPVSIVIGLRSKE